MSGSLLKSINYTFITLIPKVKNPERVFEFRPISLCNVIYKIISKVLANRFKPILNDIIYQSLKVLLLLIGLLLIMSLLHLSLCTI